MRECGEIDFDYTHLSDEEIVKDNDIQENIINQKGFFIMPSELFINVLQTHKSDTTNLNATLSNVFRNIESSSIDTKSENDFKGLFNDIDVNSSANLGERSLIKRNERLYKVMKEISKLDLDYSDNAIDAFGDAYVCLMRMYAGPPYSIKWAGDSNPLLINDPRFAPAGVLAPKSYADLAFVMHMLSWLSPSGTCAIVAFPVVLYRGGAEKKIRKYLVDNNFIDCLIQLPPNLFFGTNIATSIIVLKKNKQNDKVLFIDSSELFSKVTNKNILETNHIDTIVESYAKRENKEHFSSLVSFEEIQQKDYNLSVSSYVEQKDTREIIDIEALNAELAKL